jgi:hypothetical protein
MVLDAQPTEQWAYASPRLGSMHLLLVQTASPKGALVLQVVVKLFEHFDRDNDNTIDEGAHLAAVTFGT